MCGFIVWLGIAISHYRFRKGYLLQGGDLNDLPYRAKWFPFGPIFAFTLCLLITLGQNYQAFIGGDNGIDWAGLAATYISLPLFLAIWWGYRLKNHSRFVPYEEMNVRSAREDE
ncbi:Lysine-specific permease [compost metagenome]